MLFESITNADLEEIKTLQPADWSDIIPDISYYIRSVFCFPVKTTMGNEIAGIGAVIVYGATAWLAHIIVRCDFRNRGIGYALVEELLQIARARHADSALLTATALGKPVYTKAGFRSISEYIFMNREKPWVDQPVSDHVINFNEKYRSSILKLDQKVSGEDRKLLLYDFIEDGKLFVSDNQLLGYCLPRLKEGPIIAETEEAGLELMKIKYRTSDKAVIPVENTAALDFLRSNGFKETETRGTRMVIGPNPEWQPVKIYSRAGGNFG